MTRQYKVAAVQMSSGADKEKNLEFACNAIDEAAKNGAKLVSLPEHFLVAGKPEPGVKREERPDGPACTTLAAKAKEHGIYVVGGSIPLEIPGETRVNTATFMFGPDGKQIAKYVKLHPFDVVLPDGRVFDASKTTVRGDKIVVVDTELGKIGLSLCYDIRFPELYRRMAMQGAQVFITAAAFMMTTGKDHWEVMQRTRALENSAYVIAAAQYGGPCFGNSMIVDPWGLVIARAQEKPCIVYGDIDLDYADQCAMMLGTLSNRRPDVYPGLEKEPTGMVK